MRTATAQRRGEASLTWPCLLSAGVLAGTFLLAHSHRHGPACLLRALFHIPCPGCGLARSLTAIWQADLPLSFRYHPLGLPLFLLCCAILLAGLFRRPLARIGYPPERLLQALHHTGFLRGLTAVLLGLWVLRLGMAAEGSPFFLW